MDKLTFLEIPLFEDLDRVHKAMLLPEFTQQQFRKGDVLFEEGELGDCLYIIMQGVVRIFLPEEENERTLALLHEKEYFGEMSLLTGDPRSASARAEEDVVVLRLNKEQFDRLLLQHNTLAVQFAGILARRLALVNQKKETASTQEEVSLSRPPMPSHSEGRLQDTGVKRKGMEKPEAAQIHAHTWGYAVLVLLGGSILFWGLSQLSVSFTLAAMFSILCTGFLLVSFRLTSLAVTATAMTVLTVVFQVATLEQVLSAFVEEPLIIAFALAFIAQMIVGTGILQRMLFMLAIRIPEHWRTYGILLRITGIVAALLVPSASLRASTAMPIFAKKRDISALQAYAFLFITSSVLCWFALALLPKSQRSDIGFGDWLLAALPMALIMGIIYLIVGIVNKNKEAINLDRSMIQVQLRVMGTWSLQEKIAGLVMGLMVAGLIFAPRFGVQMLWIVVAAFFILTIFIGLHKETTRKIPYADFAAFGLLVGLAHVMANIGLMGRGSWLMIADVPPFGTLLFLFLFIVLLRLISPSMLAMMGGMVLFGPWAMGSGIHPVLIALVVALAGMIGEDYEYAGKTKKVAYAKRTAIVLLSLITVIPIWQEMQLIPGAKPSPAAKPVSALQSYAVGDVYLPLDTTMSESMRRGMQLAERQASRAELRLRYIESDKKPALYAQPPSFIVAASFVSEVLPEDTPVLMIDGEQTKGTGHRYALQLSPEAYAHAASSLLAKQTYRHISIYYADSEEGRRFASALERSAEQQGITVTDRIAGTHSRLLIGQTLEKWVRFGTQLCVVFDPDGSLAKTVLQENGSAVPSLPLLYISGEKVTEENMNASIHWLTDFDAASERKQTRQFVAQYKEVYGEIPDRMAAFGYDAVMLMQEATHVAGTSEPKALAQALHDIGRWEGAVRTYTLTDNNVQQTKEERGADNESKSIP